MLDFCIRKGDRGKNIYIICKIYMFAKGNNEGKCGVNARIL